MNAEVYSYTLPGVFELTITGRNEDRYVAYCKRIDVAPDSVASRVDVVEPTGTRSLIPPFYETRYFVRCRFVKPVDRAFVNHKMASVCDAFDFAGDTLFGTLDFVNAPGKFHFEIVWQRGPQRESAAFEWMVVSEKLNVQEDYRAIVDTIEKNAPGLVRAFLAKSRGQAGLVRRDDTNDAIWADIFNEIGDRYRKACEWVTNCPHLKYASEVEYRRAGLVKRWTPQLVNAYAGADKGKRAVSLFRTERIVPQIDTVENRFVKFTLRSIAERLEKFAATCEVHKTVSDNFRRDLRDRAQILTRLVHRPFFTHVGRFTGFRQESLAMQRKRGYADIYATWLMLQKTIDASARGFDTGHRPISALYEFWCFLKIDEILENAYGFGVPEGRVEGAKVYDDLFEEPDPDGIDATTLSALTYVFPVKDGLHVKLLYQQSYGESGKDGDLAYYNPQRPDIVLVLEREGETYMYLFDAKYRIDVRSQNGNVGLDASPSEPINDMHRYRDAILYRQQQDDQKLSRQIVGAYVLYPGRPKPHSYDYADLIAHENIGAIPLLPGKEGGAALTSFIGDILGKKTREDHLGGGKVLATRGTTVVVGEAYGEGDVWEETVDAPMWDAILKTGLCPVALEKLTREKRNSEAVKIIRLQVPNKADVMLRVTACGRQLANAIGTVSDFQTPNCLANRGPEPYCVFSVAFNRV